MDFITNIHGKTVPHDGGRGFCGAQGLNVSRTSALFFESLFLCRSSRSAAFGSSNSMMSKREFG